MISNDSNSFQKRDIFSPCSRLKDTFQFRKSSIPFALPDAICWINPITIFVYSLLLPNKSGMDHDFSPHIFYFCIHQNPLMPDSLSAFLLLSYLYDCLYHFFKRLSEAHIIFFCTFSRSFYMIFVRTSSCFLIKVSLHQHLVYIFISIPLT